MLLSVILSQGGGWDYKNTTSRIVWQFHLYSDLHYYDICFRLML